MPTFCDTKIHTMWTFYQKIKFFKSYSQKTIFPNFQFATWMADIHEHVHLH